jgi:hypothetical protein
VPALDMPLWQVGTVANTGAVRPGRTAPGAEAIPAGFRLSANSIMTFMGSSPMHSGRRPFGVTMALLSEGLHTVVFTHNEGGMELDV